MSTRGSFNTKNPTIKRILKEAQELSTGPSPDYHAAPLETNLFEWHFTLRGPPTSAFAQGLYHGRIVLPPTYPLRPPSFRFLTPSGRFEVNREICLSISGFHEESWQPAWGLRTALVALRSFMETEAKGQVGGVDASKSVRERLAGESRAWRCTGCGGRSNEDVIREVEEAAREKGAQMKVESVPEELILGYKDELEGRREKGKGREVDVEAPMSGDVVKGKEVLEPIKCTAMTSDPVAPSQPAVSGGLSAPSALTRTTTTRARPIIPPAAKSQPQSGAQTAWIDKTIVGIAIMLAFMLLKKWLAAS